MDIADPRYARMEVTYDLNGTLTFKLLPDLMADIEKFHTKYQLVYDGKPRHLPLELGRFREHFIGEEFSEYKDQRVAAAEALVAGDMDALAKALEGQLDALVDLVYVALGTAYMQGFNFREAWRRVHEANMKKIRAERPSDSKRGSTFDVVKPEGWTAPSHLDLVENHAHHRREE